MNMQVAWRGTHEKDPIFIGTFIKVLMLPASIVMDVIASTGCFDTIFMFSLFVFVLFLCGTHFLVMCMRLNHACCLSGCHLVAYKTYDHIFKEILQPLCESSLKSPQLVLHHNLLQQIMMRNILGRSQEIPFVYVNLRSNV